MKKVQLYTDGACRGNPGPGGYGCVLCYGRYEKELSGGEATTTNNRMELSAAIAGLSALKEPCEVDLYSDSQYLVNAFLEGWVVTWQMKNFKRGTKDEVKNVDLWEELIRLTNIHKVHFFWVKGHDGHAYNERCDALATAAADSFRTEDAATSVT